jgi:NADPH2:quinone reductase
MMRAIQVSTPGDISCLKLANIPKPTIEQTQLLVSNKFSGINFIDTYHRTGLYVLPTPFTPGREASGIVTEVGSQVIGFALGDRVCYTGTATYAEYSAVNPDFCVKLPEQVSFELGAALLLQGLTAMALSTMMHKVKKDEVVLIHAAAGGTGGLLVQLCKIKGAIVIGTTSTPEKKELAIKSGCDHVILYKSEDILEHVMRITNNVGVDVVFDGIGKTTFDVSVKSLKTLGSMVSFGNASGKVDPIDIMKLVPKCIRLSRPSLFNLVKTREQFLPMATELLNLVGQGSLKLSVSKVYGLEEVGTAHNDLETQKTTGKIVLKCN